MLPTLTKADQRKRRRIMHIISRTLRKDAERIWNYDDLNLFNTKFHRLVHDAVTEVLGTEE